MIIFEYLCFISVDTLGTFYEDDGRSIRFANLFDEISQSVPHEKIHQMKDFIQRKKSCFCVINMNKKKENFILVYL